MSKFFHMMFFIVFCFGVTLKAENDTLTTNSTDEVDEGNSDLYLVQLKPNFTNPEYFVCLIFEYFFQIKVLN